MAVSEVGAYSYYKQAVQKSHPSSNNRILNQHISSSTIRWDNSGTNGLYYLPEIPKGIDSQLPTALISSLIHSLLDVFCLSLFYFSTALTTLPRVTSPISSLHSNLFWGLQLESPNVNNRGNPSLDELIWKPRSQKPDPAKYENRIIPSFWQYSMQVRHQDLNAQVSEQAFSTSLLGFCSNYLMASLFPDLSHPSAAGHFPHNFLVTPLLQVIQCFPTICMMSPISLD